MLLQHIFWNRPEECERIYEWLLQQFAADNNTEQIHYLLSGVFGRACRSLEDTEKLGELIQQMEELQKVLTDKLFHTLLASEGQSIFLLKQQYCYSGDAPQLMQHVWLSRETMEAVMLALQPRLEKSREEVERTLFEASL